MSRLDSTRFKKEDIFFFFDMDNVKLRWDYVQGKAFQKFDGEVEFECSGWSYFNKAISEGVEISKEEYLMNKKLKLYDSF
jgi:hypothetical protein